MFNITLKNTQLCYTKESNESLSSPPKLFWSLIFGQRTSCDKESDTKEYSPERATLIQCHKHSPHPHPEDVAILKYQVITRVFCQTYSNYILLIIAHLSSFYSCSEGTDFSFTKVAQPSSSIFFLSGISDCTLASENKAALQELWGELPSGCGEDAGHWGWWSSRL